MKQQKIAGYIGGIMALILFANQIYHAIRISRGFEFTESLLPELSNAIINGLIVISPALVLILSKNVELKIPWIIWSYPIITAFGMLNYFTSSDPLEAGIPMISLVYPFCLLFAIFIYLRNQIKKIKNDKDSENFGGGLRLL